MQKTIKIVCNQCGVERAINVFKATGGFKDYYHRDRATEGKKDPDGWIWYDDGTKEKHDYCGDCIGCMQERLMRLDFYSTEIERDAQKMIREEDTRHRKLMEDLCNKANVAYRGHFRSLERFIAQRKEFKRDLEKLNHDLEKHMYTSIAGSAPP